MMGTTHSVTGMVLWTGVGPLITDDPLVLFAGLTIAAVLPYGADLDHPKSTSSRAIWGPLHSVMGKSIAALMGGHRHGMHSLWACLFAGLAVAALTTAVVPEHATELGVAGVLGWFGGVLGDMLTKQRVHFLWPASNVKVGLPIFETGKLGEKFFNAGQAALGLWLAYVHLGGASL